MKKNYYLLLVFLLMFNVFQAQKKDEEKKEKESKIQVIGYGGIGFAVIESNNEPKYNLNSNSGEILLNFKLFKKSGLAIGVSHNQLSGNGFNSMGDFYHERSTLKIPLLYTMESGLTEKIDFLANIGFYGQTIIKDEYQFLNNTQSNIYDGWNFGLESTIAIVFDYSKSMSFGINFSGQLDLSKFSTKDNQVISDKQRIENQNLIGLLFIMKF